MNIKPLLVPFLPVLLLAACQATPGPEVPAASPATRLVADPGASFATPAMTFIVGLVGDGWALEAGFSPPALVYHERERPFTVSLSPDRCRFLTGPDLHKYVHVPSGPPTPPPPETAEYVEHPVSDLTVTIRAPEQGGWVEVTLSRFTAGGEVFELAAPVRLLLQGPNPIAP